VLLLILGLEAGRHLPAPVHVSRLGSLAALALCLVGVGLGLRGVVVNGMDFRLAVAAGAVVVALVAGERAAQALRGLGLGVAAARAGVFALVFLAGAIGRNAEQWQTPVSAGSAPARAVIAWARTTDPDSQFLLPPSDPFALEFMRHADREVFLVREGANSGSFFPAMNDEFAGRVSALGVADPLKFRQQLDPAYEDLDEAKIREIARRYGVRYFVPAPGERYQFPSAFRTDKYVVYDLS
jgi:hypothetical protein